MPAKTTTVLSNSDVTLRRITLDVPIRGFRDFITPWLVTEAKSGRAVIIDPGPACGILSLKETLDELDISHLDLVLLTHIHIDHAGGTGHLLQAFPEAKLAVHPKGLRHVVDPSRLWSSTVETLGKDVAYAYGKILPIPGERILPAGTVPAGFDIIDTPGHSHHHQCYIYRSMVGGLIFEGEAAGVYLGEGYLRPATPPRFFYETSTKSIAALWERADTAALILYGHYGYSSDVANLLDASLVQLALWKEVTRTIVAENSGAVLEDLVDLSVERLVKMDQSLAELGSLPADIRERENYFLHNSARGFVSAQLEPTSAH